MEPAERRARRPSGKAPNRPWFAFRGDHRYRPGIARCDDRVVSTTLSAPPRPPLVRPRSGRVIAGVAVGTAAHLRQDPLLVRVAFALLATTGIGVVAYALLWLTMPVAAPGEEPDEPPLPGWRPRGAKQWTATVVLGLLAVSLLSGLSRWNNSVVLL
ncbi:MAG: PspC domain-containing protein, partial [Blastococcus sp.]|nr:PspC domain-containing protein [Blastococcus sp.]